MGTVHKGSFVSCSAKYIARSFELRARRINLSTQTFGETIRYRDSQINEQ